ncbi:hypothetical protein [Arthrobacter sp.]|uniref:hypothetical protein n=1 Tax=Arthrobacter sp. TaxID=1667 RepID=UPI0026DFFF8F|nr:hypothetical protein [Arthrobacter sp.]MDO5751688.1 hypothetical protein [Arthrobacter sp.]
MAEHRTPEPSAGKIRSGATWRRGLGVSAIAGAIGGIVWWLAAPTGAFYGDGKDYATWFPRDATLAVILVLAGAATAVIALRAERTRRRKGDGAAVPAGAFVLVLAVCGLVGSVIAWRMGVFAGDLFGNPPSPLPNPSMVFSLRSGSVLLLWPLVSVLIVFLRTMYAYSFIPARAGERP